MLGLQKTSPPLGDGLVTLGFVVVVVLFCVGGRRMIFEAGFPCISQGVLELFVLCLRSAQISKGVSLLALLTREFFTLKK